MRWSSCRFFFGFSLGIALLSAGSGLPAQTASPTRFVVVIDAAHGGDDTGGHLDDGQLEKNATLALSIRLRSQLTARGFDVVTTRDGDTSRTPVERAEIANHVRAQACISLHVAESGFGVHMFTSSLAPAPATTFLPWKTAQSAWITRSVALAGALNSALSQAGVNVTLGSTSLPGIDSMTCPAVAIELAPERDKGNKITAQPDNPDYQARIASMLATGLLEWRAEGRRP
ncbi:MAG: N-acetylmuramoyl-L-alanine amidase [Acidobacteriota bacterium]